MTRYAPRIAAVVYDQDTHSLADHAFLREMARIDIEWHDQMRAANLQWGGGSEEWQIVKRFATKSRDEAYAVALHNFEGEIEFQQAAE